MIKTYSTHSGYVYAYCEYQLCNEQGKAENDGEFLYVFNAWIHPDRRSRRIIDRFVYDILSKHDNVRYVYWDRPKYNNRQSLYNVHRNGSIKMTKKEKIYGF